MAKIPAKVTDRFTAGLKRFQPVLEGAVARDVNEANTVTIVKDLLAEIFGYDKYEEVTAEHAIRGTYCDLAINLDGKLALLVEVKATGSHLKDAQIKQAVDYAANQGCDWVVLTNAHRWVIYRVTFAKPIDHEMIADINLLALNHRKEEDHQLLWLLSKEGWIKSHLDEFAAQKEALSRFTIGALLLSEPVLNVLRRELRRVSPDARVDVEQISHALTEDVIKREILEGDRAAKAKKLVSRAAKRTLRSTADDDDAENADPDAPAAAAGSSQPN